MASNRIETPGALAGDEQQQLEQIYRYLVRMADDLNIQLENIGGNELTDSERQIMLKIIRKDAEGKVPEDQIKQELYQMESLKSLIIKTASYVMTSIDEYRATYLRETVAEGQFGKYVRNTGLDVEVNPEGITQNYSFQEVVQGLKHYEINAKNYIKTGLLRTVSDIPVYGVAIGKDVVEFTEDGQEIYKDENKVAELTADELSFYQGGNKLASYTGSKISFLIGGAEVMYIQSGKIYAGKDLEIKSGQKIIIGDWTYDEDGTVYAASSTKYFVIGQKDVWEAGDDVFQLDNSDGKFKIKTITTKQGTVRDEGYVEIARSADPDGGTPSPGASWPVLLVKDMNGSAGWVGTSADKVNGYFDDLYYETLHAPSSREMKHGIRDMEPQGVKLDALRPVTFIYNDDKKERRRTGLIYEEAIEEMPEICTGDESAKAISYVEMIPMLLKEIQSLRARVKQLEEREDE